MANMRRSTDTNDFDVDANEICVRKLCVGPIEADMINQIKMFFERFGAVNSVEIGEEDSANTNFAFVEFKSSEAAAAVLSLNGIHQIRGCNVQVKAAEPWQQPDHILNALDDDCLRVILLQLNQEDLTNAANVCVRFNEQAKSAFSTKYDKKLDLIDCTYEAARNALQTFGSSARSVNVKRFYRPGESNPNYYFMQRYILKSEFLSTIDQCCTSQLKELTFKAICLENKSTSDVLFDSALCTIEKLSFNDCEVQNIFNASCTELKVLHMSNCDLINVNMSNINMAMPKLEELRLASTPIDVRFINGIIRSESKLKKFALIDYSYCTNTWYTTRVIVQHCPNLVELELTMDGCTDAQYAESVHRLKQFTSLKVLKLDLGWKSTAPLSTLLASNSAPIEHMKLADGQICVDTIKAISQMKHLKVLELFDISGYTDEHMIELTKGLGSKLERLQFGGWGAYKLTTIGLKKMLPFATKLSLLTLESEKITIDADDYKSMLCTVKKRPEKIKLLIECKEGTVEVSEQVQNENCDWFFIDAFFQINSKY